MAATPARPAGGAPRADVVRGIGLATVGYGLFAVQDAIVKLLVARVSVPQILCLRSLVILAIALLGARVRGTPATLGGRSLAIVAGRAVLILVAWLTYFAAGRQLTLAEMTTLYFAAPIFAVVLSVAVLHERVGASRWLAVALGFAGVLVAARPEGTMAPAPAALALVAALSWGASTVLARLVARTESTTAQLVVSNALFALACAAALPWLWVTPSGGDLLLILLLGVIGGVGQFLVFDSFRYAPASVIAPVEYTALIWAVILGYWIWQDVPRSSVILGAVLIVSASLGLVWSESRGARSAEAGS